MTFDQQQPVLNTAGMTYPDWVYSNLAPMQGLAAGANDGKVRVVRGKSSPTTRLIGSTDQAIKVQKPGSVQG